MLFSAQQMWWGVCAEQIEELLDVKDLHEQVPLGLIFPLRYRGRNIQGIDFSLWIDAQEFAGRSDRRATDIFPAAKILIIKRVNAERIGVRIDQLEGLVCLPIEHVHALPRLMQRTRRIQGLWGIAVVENRMIPLVDLSQLMVNDRSL